MSWDGFKNPGKCYTCGEHGHFARNCPQSRNIRPNTPRGPSGTGRPSRGRPNPGASTFVPGNRAPVHQGQPAPPTTAPVPVAPSNIAASGTVPILPPRVPLAPLSTTDPEAFLTSIGLARTEAQSSWSAKHMMYEYGLRTGHGTRQDIPQGQTAHERNVITNYIKIKQKPKYIYVYKLKFVREIIPANQERLLKNRSEKGAIFTALKNITAYANLQTRMNYVTDYDLIWATKPLFHDKDDEASMDTAPATQLHFQVDHPFTGERITWYSVQITWDRRIAAQQDVQSLLGNHGSNVPVAGNDDTEILTRGINAFMTQYARENATTQQYETTAANKFFLTQPAPVHQQRLNAPGGAALTALRGFALSARPGNDDWYLNIHVGASPFMLGGRIPDLFHSLRSMKLSVREVFNAFKGRQVIFNHPVSRTVTSRFVTEMATATLRDVRSWPAFDTALRGINQTLETMSVNVAPRGAAPDRYQAGIMTVHGLDSFRGFMTAAQTTNMLNFACKLPVLNKRYLEVDGFRLFGVNIPRASQFDMAVERDLLRVPARWLTPPRLRYRNNVAPLRFEEASWNLDKREFFEPSPLPLVSILDLHPSNNERDLRQLGVGLEQTLRNLGLTNVRVQTHNVQRGPNDPSDPEEKRLRQYLQEISPDPSGPVLVVLPDNGPDLYARVKRVADLQLGWHAVCAIGSKMHQFGQSYGDNRYTGEQYLANIGMKLNLKGLGLNHAVHQNHLKAILDDPFQPVPTACQTIIIGADVAHPTGSARPGCPSIAAIVGSVDDDYLQYPGSMRLQVGRQETIDELGDMVKERLIDWAEKHQQTLPANMLFYRDGVSESQYTSVRSFEIPQLQGAFNDAYDYIHGQGSAQHQTPQFNLTFVVVGKRHNTRFFTDDACKDNTFLSDLKKNETFDRVRPGLEKEEGQTFQAKRNQRHKLTRVNHNILPGFVVDEVITHPHSDDFFLQSHKPLQGTGRSAHYFVLTNQMQLNADNLQRATHALCYIYARATKGVSYCAPAYYADRLCDRGRDWLRDWLLGNLWLEQDRASDPPETFDAFKVRVRDHVDQSPYWRPQRNSAPTQKYNQPRRNPWHPNLDNVMFYL